MTREQLMTLGGISEQTSRIMSELSVRDEVSRADIVIKPNVEEWVGTEFDRMASIIPLGNTAAIEVEKELVKLAVAPDQFKNWRNRVENHPLPHPEVDLIVLDNLTRIDDQVIHRLIHIPTDAPLDLDLLKTNLGEIYELGLVESVDFDLQLVAGYNILTIIVREKPYAPYIIHFGGAYSLGYDGASNMETMVDGAGSHQERVKSWPIRTARDMRLPSSSWARSRCSRVWPADICVRIRALPFGTTGNEKPMT